MRVFHVRAHVRVCVSECVCACLGVRVYLSRLPERA